MSIYIELTKSIGYRHINDNTITEGDHEVDLDTGNLISFRGSVYVKEINPDTQEPVKGKFIGNFNGHPEDGDMSYGFSNMTLADMMLVMAAIQEVVPHTVQSSSSED